jgi:hypothetical protein
MLRVRVFTTANMCPGLSELAKTNTPQELHILKSAVLVEKRYWRNAESEVKLTSRLASGWPVHSAPVMTQYVQLHAR